MARRIVYRLPDGSETRDARDYYAAWTVLASKIGRKLGLILHGFDPGLMFVDVETGNTISIPVWLAYRLNEALQEEDSQ